MIARPAFFLIGLAVLALSLGGCGRKGPLDLPPQAQALAPTPAPVAEERGDPGPGSVIDQANRARDSEPATPRGQKRKFVLDPLLGE